MDLTVIRHGEGSNNLPTFRPGDVPDNEVPLTSNGVFQAVQLGQWLVKSFHLHDCVEVTSTFLRAKETRRLAQLSSSCLICHDNLDEHFFGAYMSRNPPNIIQRTQFDLDFAQQIALRAPEGSSILDDYFQSQQFIQSLFRIFPHRQVVLYTHRFRAMVLRMVLEGLPPTDQGWQRIYREKEALGNCSVIHYPDALDADGQMTIVNHPYQPKDALVYRPYASILDH